MDPLVLAFIAAQLLKLIGGVALFALGREIWLLYREVD